MVPSTKLARSLVTAGVVLVAALASANAFACTCRSDVDNFCLYGATNDCAMTQPGGYCDPNGDGGFGDADWVRGWIEHHDACTAPPSGQCTCRSDVDNFCSYGANAAGCGMTSGGGYCDPNGDGSFADGDWVRGWFDFRAACVDAQPPAQCACRTAVDNLCSYGPNAAGCDMTAARGYCDPDGNGDFADGDWVRGWFDYRERCVSPPPATHTPTPTPTATPSSGVRERRIGIEGEVCLYYDELSVAWGVRPGARIINNGTTTARIVMRLFSLAREPRFGDPLDGRVIATGFFGAQLPPQFAFRGQFSFHRDVTPPPPSSNDVLVVAVIAIASDGSSTYTDFLSFGRIADGFAPPSFTTCATGSPTTAPAS